MEGGSLDGGQGRLDFGEQREMINLGGAQPPLVRGKSEPSCLRLRSVAKEPL